MHLITSQRSFFILAAIASLLVQITAFDLCHQIDNKNVDLARWNFIPIATLQRDDFFNQIESSFIGGDLSVQIAEYPYGAGPFITVRQRVSSVNAQDATAVTGRVAVAVVVGKRFDYFWLPRGTICQFASPRSANYQDISDIKLYNE